jgi:hypothetical protein
METQLTEPNRAIPPEEAAEWRECRAEVHALTEKLIQKYDIRAVAASLGAAYATVSSASMFSGDAVLERFSLEALVGTLREFFTAPDKPPVVYYKDQGEMLGRKQ